VSACHIVIKGYLLPTLSRRLFVHFVHIILSLVPVFQTDVVTLYAYMHS